MNNSPVTICGNVANDPEITATASGRNRATFSVASEHRYMSGGEWQSDTSFINVVAWGYVADDLQGLLEKGSRVIVKGRLNNRSYDDSEGNRKYITEIIAERVGLDVGGLESAKRRTSSGGGQRATVGASTASDEDIW